MSRYQADVILGSNSGIQTVEINSSSIPGVSEQICKIYHVTPDKIRNIREVRNSNETGDDSGGTLATISIGGVFLLFVFFTPYFLMLLFGVGGAYLTTKLASKTPRQLIEQENTNIYVLVLLVALVMGGTGLVIGDKIQNEYLNESMPENVK